MVLCLLKSSSQDLWSWFLNQIPMAHIKTCVLLWRYRLRRRILDYHGIGSSVLIQTPIAVIRQSGWRAIWFIRCLTIALISRISEPIASAEHIRTSEFRSQKSKRSWMVLLIILEWINKNSRSFPAVSLLALWKESPMELGFGRMHKLVWFFNEKDAAR